MGAAGGAHRLDPSSSATALRGRYRRLPADSGRTAVDPAAGVLVTERCARRPRRAGGGASSFADVSRLRPGVRQ
ncbi:hypothetical protein AB8O55_27135 [Saccharopolyspora cebuensis]|uniref:Uncharacterized protein n=1 Tax=Saccharopolyspora cebuensis TaxID=418759 RepID=A0ABV4CPR8_9PSEU